MTSHELANRLLQMPDLPILTNDSEYGFTEIAHIEQEETRYHKPDKDCKISDETTEGPCIVVH